MSDDTHIQPTLEEPQATIAGLTAQLEELKKQNEEYLNGWKRAKADYVNFKNDQEKRSKELAQFSVLTNLLHYLPIVENFRTAFVHLPDSLKDSDWVKGVAHIHTQMKEMLKTLGVSECESSIGKKFDPQLHQAVGNEQIGDKEDDVVTQEVSAGYTFADRVIVPAKVIVNKKPEPHTSNI